MHYFAVILDQNGQFNAVIMETELDALTQKLNAWKVESDITVAGIFKGVSLDFEETFAIEDK